MKHWKLHLWLMINISMIMYLLIEPSSFKVLFLLFTSVVIISTLLLDLELKIKNIFINGFGFKEFFAVFGFVYFIFISVRLSKQLNNPESDFAWMTDTIIRYGLITFLSFLVICYIFAFLKRIKNEAEDLVESQEISNQ